MNAPSFRVEMTEDGKMLLHYYSDRKGLYHIVPGKINHTFSIHIDDSDLMLLIVKNKKK